VKLGACPAFTDSYLPTVTSITENGTDYLYRVGSVLCRFQEADPGRNSGRRRVFGTAAASGHSRLHFDFIPIGTLHPTGKYLTDLLTLKQAGIIDPYCRRWP
jgi:hypothetical protein